MVDNVVRGICVPFALKDFLFETLLAFLPTMSTHNITCDVLKEYQIVPLQSGSIQRNRICLAQFANARSRFLAVNRARIQRVFIPVESFPIPRRGVFIEMINFLNIIQTIDRRKITAKASKVIFNAYFEDLQPTVQNLSPQTSKKLASSGFVLLHGSGYTKSAHNGFSNFHCKAQKVNVHN